MSIIIGLFIFIFKTTSLKTLLLSIVASLVVLVIIVWFMSSSRSVLTDSVSRENIIMIFVSFVIILLSVCSYVFRWKKILVSIFWSLGLFAIPSFFLFISLYYNRYLRKLHKTEFPYDYDYRSSFEIWFDAYGFWAIIFIWIMTVFIYAKFIRTLRAQPE